MLEKELERYFCERVKEESWLTYKFTSPGNAGVPDRMIIMNDGTVFFVELKAPGKELRALQKKVMEKLRSHRVHTFVIDKKEGVDLVLHIMKHFRNHDLLPMPCVKNTPQVTLKDWLLKLHEECDELEEAIFLGNEGVSLMNRLCDVMLINDTVRRTIAEEGSDVMVVIASLLEALGISEEERIAALHRVNNHNKERGRW